MKISVFHEDVFYEYFQPIERTSSPFAIWGGNGFETFGSDFQIVQEYNQSFVWTVLDSTDDSDQWISPGLNFVNRVCYLLTSIPHNDVPILFRTEGRPRPISKVGLARRLTTLRKLMKMHNVSSS
jgi:hypothetical protein